MELELQQGEIKISKNGKLQEEIENRLNHTGLFVVDRMEKDQVICENRLTQEIVRIPKSVFPWDVKEGDVFQKTGESLTKNREEQQSIEKRVQEKMKRLWKE